MYREEAIATGHGEAIMVDLLVDLFKRDLNEALAVQNITFDQVHYMLRQTLEKLLSYDSKYKDQIQKYIDKEQELNTRIQKAVEELNELKKQLASNDEKIYEAIKNL
jgi:uncharacterized protein Yka (UPF0111/DUF47 family)